MLFEDIDLYLVSQTLTIISEISISLFFLLFVMNMNSENSFLLRKTTLPLQNILLVFSLTNIIKIQPPFCFSIISIHDGREMLIKKPCWKDNFFGRHFFSCQMPKNFTVALLFAGRICIFPDARESRLIDSRRAILFRR